MTHKMNYFRRLWTAPTSTPTTSASPSPAASTTTRVFILFSYLLKKRTHKYVKSNASDSTVLRRGICALPPAKAPRTLLPGYATCPPVSADDPRWPYGDGELEWDVTGIAGETAYKVRRCLGNECVSQKSYSVSEHTYVDESQMAFCKDVLVSDCRCYSYTQHETIPCNFNIFFLALLASPAPTARRARCPGRAAPTASGWGSRTPAAAPTSTSGGRWRTSRTRTRSRRT